MRTIRIIEHVSLDGVIQGPVEGLGADITAGIAKVKAGAGPELIVWGSSTLTPILISEGLAEEGVLLVMPVKVGRGTQISGTSCGQASWH